MVTSEPPPATAPRGREQDDTATDAVPVLGVLVCRDGAEWLPGVLGALRELTVRPRHLLAVDAGSTDRSPRLLAAAGAGRDRQDGSDGEHASDRAGGADRGRDQGDGAADRESAGQEDTGTDDAEGAVSGEEDSGAGNSDAGNPDAGSSDAGSSGLGKPDFGKPGTAKLGTGNPGTDDSEAGGSETADPDVAATVEGDTGDADAAGAQPSGNVPGEGLIDEVLTLPSGTDFGAAVEHALAHATQHWGDPGEWLWLIHDDSAPEPDCLENLLEVAESDPAAAVLGPHGLDWHDPRLLVDTGLSIDSSGHRQAIPAGSELDPALTRTGSAPISEVLAVSTACALLRRDVFDQLGDVVDDVDLGWRVNASGSLVLCVPAARMRHASASRSGASTSRSAQRVNGVRTFLVNTSYLSWLAGVPRLLVLTLLRGVAFGLLRRLPEARAEFGVAGRLLTGRMGLRAARQRRRGRVRRALLTSRRARLRNGFRAAFAGLVRNRVRRDVLLDGAAAKRWTPVPVTATAAPAPRIAEQQRIVGPHRSTGHVVVALDRGEAELAERDGAESRGTESHGAGGNGSERDEVEQHSADSTDGAGSNGTGHGGTGHGGTGHGGTGGADRDESGPDEADHDGVEREDPEREHAEREHAEREDAEREDPERGEAESTRVEPDGTSATEQKRPSPVPRASARQLFLVPVGRWRMLRELLFTPPVVLTAALLVVALLINGVLADRFGAGLQGGRLLPVGGLGQTWMDYLSAWHPVNGGTASPASPSLLVVALLGTVFVPVGGPAAVVAGVLLFGVPLAGVSAYAATRGLPARRVVRAVAAGAYAVLPAATASAGQGRLDVVVAHVLLPWLLAGIASVVGLPGLRGRRGSGYWLGTACATAAGLAVLGAFAPLMHVVLIVLAVLGFVLVSGAARRAAGLAVVVLLPVACLLPWPVALIDHPGLLWDGLGARIAELPARAWPLVLSPDGSWTSWPGGLLVLAAVAAVVVAPNRAMLPGGVVVLLGWSVSLLVGAAPGWTGAPLSLVAAGLLWILLVAGPVRRPVPARIARPLLLTGLAVLAAAGVAAGASGPLSTRPVLAEPGTTLLLTGQVPRMAEGAPRFGDDDLVPAAGAERWLGGVRSDLFSSDPSRVRSGLAAVAAHGAGRIVLPEQDAARVRSAAGDLVTGRGTELHLRTPSTPVQLLGPDLARRARFTAQPPAEGRPLTVPATLPNVTVRVSEGGAGRALVLGAWNEPGWQAEVGGRTVALAGAWAGQVAVPLPESAGDVRVYYSEVPRATLLVVQAAAILFTAIGAMPARRGADARR